MGLLDELFDREQTVEVVGILPKELALSVHALRSEHQRRSFQVKLWEKDQIAQRIAGCGSEELAQEIAEAVDAEGTEIWATEHKPFLDDLYDTTWDAIYDHFNIPKEEREMSYKVRITTLQLLRIID